MKIKPDDQWRWYFDENHQRIMLDLANGMVFRSCFAPKMLARYAKDNSQFSVDDAALFFTFEEQAKKLSLSAELRAELILNALIASRFLKPQLPKSWYFSSCYKMEKTQLGQLVEVDVIDNCCSAHFIVAEVGDNASVCLLTDQKLELHDRCFNFCEPIKIMNDRLSHWQPVRQSLVFGQVI